jgi:tetratricopeptide (TPR) repeat protein
LRAQVLVQAAWLQQSSYGSNSALAAQLAQEGLQLAREIRDKECTMMAAIVLIRNDVLSRKHKNIIEEVKAIARSSTSRWWLAHTLIAFSQADALNNLVTAQIECEEGLVLAREVGDAWLLISAIVSWVRLLGSTEGRSRALIAECIELARQVGDWLGLTQSLKLLAQEATYRGDFAVAQKLFEERLQAQRFLGNMPGIVGALVDIGHLAHRVGNLKGAERVMYEALALAPLGHDQRSVAGVEIMVRVCLDRGEYERAQLYADQALTVARGYDDVHAIGHFLWLSAYAYTICGDLAQAHRSLDELFRIAQQTGIAYIRGFYLEIEGMVALQHHDLGHARNMLEECIGLRRKLGEPEAVNVIWATFQLSCTEAVAGNYERASKLMHQCLQFHRQAPFAVDLPLMFEATAKLLVDTSHNSQIAARLWGAAEVLREQIGAPMWPVDRPEYERRVAEARAQIGSEEWEVAWAAGRTLSWEQAADQALAWMRRSPADLFGLSHP